jgi:hypothetical protein
MGLLQWLDRLAGRVNRKVETTAIATPTDAGGTAATVNTVGVKAGLGEIEEQTEDETKADA